MEKVIDNIILLHAVLGGIALLSGAIALSTKKGSATHKKAGRWFYNAMLSSIVISLIVAWMPGHENMFLFGIGIFSLYFILSGYRALRYLKPNFSIQVDQFIAWAIIAVGLCMIVLPILLESKINIILSVFGGVGMVFGIRDLLLLRDTTKLRKIAIKQHLGKMTGGYIAAVSAFFVVNNILPGMWNWFAPSIIGTIFITYWMNKMDRKKSF